MAQGSERAPAASLGILDATMVGVGAMIGAGIFVLTGLAAGIAGPAALLVFALNGVVTAFTAMSYAELASAIPKSGGGYAYIREVFSAPVAFVMGWTRWFTYMAAGALYALGFSANFIELAHIYYPDLPAGPIWEVTYALVAVLGFVGLNAVSTEASGGAETVVTVLKIAILLLFAGFGASAASTGAFVPFFPGDLGAVSLFSAMALTFIAFQGYDLIATITEEVKNPRKNIPRAIFLSLGVTLLIYLVVVFVAIGTLGAPELARAGERGIAEAAAGFMPELPLIGTGAAIIAFGAVFSTLSALNAVVLASSRVVFAMGREGQFPRRFGMIHHRYGTPFKAVMISATIMLAAVMLIPIETVSNLASLFSLLGFILVNVAVIRLRQERPNLDRPYEIPFYPVPPVLGIVCNVGLGFFIDAYTWSLAVAWLAIGAGAYVALKKARRVILERHGEDAA